MVCIEDVERRFAYMPTRLACGAWVWLRHYLEFIAYDNPESDHPRILVVLVVKQTFKQKDVRR